jgi:hypothetical protein
MGLIPTVPIDKGIPIHILCATLCIYGRTATHRHAQYHTLPLTTAYSRAHCYTLQHCCTIPNCHTRTATLLHTAAHSRITLPHTTTHCRTAAHCRTLPYTAVRSATLYQEHCCTLPHALHAHYRVHCPTLSLAPLALLLHCCALPHKFFQFM